ncbi:phage tail protein [Klebsiella aerogenes]|jgi:phage-related tail fiber protein|uniref:phage tail-collar fiber domain-containing protein n=1 Tax=Klebsiella aerogenes TaxID=548 RepID=UPI0002AB35E4|nr:phage tail protein [Klebsiella aerogenes]DAY54770.1 MAG TPA: tail collar fiber protein [Caudoviricetes sp.]AMH08983.1 phage tail protein [Klebsiella aerogenes]AML39043.1 Putative tail fiber protein [Klebsiella aerogenes]ATY04322.1 phage tail protein [Klebsiella aerogenes]AXY27259.1 phage tail protein [Klebsiella aerogenes]
MTAKYYAILTNQGAARLANATALGTKLNLTQMAVGDANGKLPTPDPAQTALINQQRIAPLNMLTVDPANVSQIIAEQIIPENEGGFWIREIGLYDDDGVLIAVANCPETYKPKLAEGSGRTQTIRMILIVSSTTAITLKIDPSVVLATRQYVDEQVIEVKSYVDDVLAQHEKSRNHPDATTAAKGFVQLSSATNSTSEALAATPKAVKAANDNANNRLSKTGNLSEIKSAGTAAQLSAQQNIGLSSYGIAPALAAETGKDLNSLLTQGVFVLTNPLNAPEPANNAGTVFVEVMTWQSGSGDNGYRLIQRLYGYGTSGSIANRVWVRTRTTGWGDWYELYSQANKPTAADVGAIVREDAPVGIPHPWPLVTAPLGWLICNGATFDKAMYPYLASAYPSGKLPDLRGEFIRGWDNGRGVDPGRSLLAWQDDMIKKHSHTLGTYKSVDAGIKMPVTAGAELSNSGVGGAMYTGEAGSSETRPRNIAFNYIVRAA